MIMWDTAANWDLDRGLIEMQNKGSMEQNDPRQPEYGKIFMFQKIFKSISKVIPILNMICYFVS